MTKGFNNLLILLFCPIVFFSTSCQKKWKKPTNVSFDFKLNPNTSNGPINFTSGNLSLSKISFKGERKQGTHEVALDQQYNGVMPIALAQNSIASGIQFDIPQGTYSQMEIKLETNTDQSGNSLLVNGAYIDSLNVSYNVRFKFSAPDVLTMVAINSSGGGSGIVLVEDQPATATIIMNPNYWFAPLSKSMLDHAEHELVNGVKTIKIDNDENEDLYNLIVGRIKEGNSVIIN